MLVLSNIHSLLTQFLALPHLHTAAVFTPAGELVSYVSDPGRSKDEVLLIGGLSGEMWQGTRAQGHGRLDWGLDRILVTPVEDNERVPEDDKPPLMLIALASTRALAWEELESNGDILAKMLSASWSRHREELIVTKPAVPTPATALSSKPPARP